VTVGRRAGARLVLGMLALAACSSGHAKSAPGHGQPTATPSPAPAVPATLPASTTTVTTTAAGTTTTTTPTLAVAPAAALRLGRWSPIGLIVNGVPTLSATLEAGRPGGPLSGVVRINGAVTRPVLYAGTAEPGGRWPNQGTVAVGRRAGLVAAFNSGFHTYASAGGWFDHGRTAVALRSGAASLVIRADGSATVGLWGRDLSLTGDVVSVRQNLGLLVDGGANQSGAGSWGATLGRVRYTWRSGLGVDAAGNLLYCGGPGLDAQSLAQVLIQAGALRAMELDINPQWVAFSYYSGPSSGTDLAPGMFYGPSRWLSGSSRDFIAVFTR
jgi:hypothetical protein